MHGLPELRIPNDWKLRTRVFVSPAKKPRPGLTPLVSRAVYDAERQPSASIRKPRPRGAHETLLRANAT